jgi:hypothetical protein
MMIRLVPLAVAGSLLVALGAGCSDPGKTADSAGIPKLDQRARALPPETACVAPAPATDAVPGAIVPRCTIAFGRAVGALLVAAEGSPAVVSLVHAATGSWTLPAMTYATAFAPLPAELEARTGVASATRDRAMLAVGGELIAYALSTGEVVGRAPGPGGTISDLEWTSDGAWMVVAAGGQASVLDANGKAVRGLAVDGSARLVAVTPDGAHTAVANDVGAITLFGTGDTPPRTITPSLQAAEGLAFAGDLLWVAGSDGTLRAFDIATGTEKAKLDAGTPLTRLALSVDGKRAAVAGRDRAIRIYDLPEGRAGATLAWHEAQVTGLAWGADATLLSGDGDGKLAVWDASSGTR